MSYDQDHYDTGDGYPQNRGDVRFLGHSGRHEFMAECDAEPADFENCLACYAYGVEQGLSDEEMFEITAKRRDEPVEPPSLYMVLLTERNQLAAEMTAARMADDGLDDQRFDQGYLAALDRAIDLVVRRDGIG